MRSDVARGQLCEIAPAPGVHYYECVSYARQRIGVVSQPFCVDQLNPAGFNVFNVPYKENTCFFPAWETGNLKINMAEADLSPTTFTSSSASDSDYDISLRIPLKMKTKIYTLKLPVIIIIRPTEKAMQSLKSAGVQRCQSRSTGSSCHPVELIKLLKTFYK